MPEGTGEGTLRDAQTAGENGRSPPLPAGVFQRDMRLRVVGDGPHWSQQTAPTPPGGGKLAAVSCASDTSCVAVGTSSAGPSFSETLTGTTWTLQTPPAFADAILSGVASASDCTAAGYGVTRSGGESTVNGPIIEHFDGTSWSIETSPTNVKRLPDRRRLLDLGELRRRRDNGRPRNEHDAFADRAVERIDLDGRVHARTAVARSTSCRAHPASRQRTASPRARAAMPRTATRRRRLPLAGTARAGATSRPPAPPDRLTRSRAPAPVSAWRPA